MILNFGHSGCYVLPALPPTIEAFIAEVARVMVADSG